MYQIIFIFFAFSTFLLSNEYFDKAHQDVTGSTPEILSQERTQDLSFYFVSSCCCTNDILNIFQEYTEKEVNRLNPATDVLIQSLTMVYEKVDLKKKGVENYRYINALYSFADRTDSANRYGSTEVFQSDVEFSGEGCKDLDFNNQEDREWYSHNIIDRFEGGGDYGIKGGASNAFGKYQFMPADGSIQCQKAPPELNCCGGTYILHHGSSAGKTTDGLEWRTGANAVACQDAMFENYTKGHQKEIENYDIPINSCTLYLAHQQGVGGLNWIMGGKVPSSYSISTLQNVVSANIGKKNWNDAINSGADINNPDVLREMFVKEWSSRFGGDIRSSTGKVAPIEKVTEEAEKFATLIPNRDSFYREGILFELYRQKEELDSILQNISTHKTSISTPVPIVGF